MLLKAVEDIYDALESLYLDIWEILAYAFKSTTTLLNCP
jgi:hypothetical protein